MPDRQPIAVPGDNLAGEIRAASMRIRYLALFSLVFVAVAGPAFAQATNPYNVSWSALDPGKDWAAQVLRSLFPIAGSTAGSSTGSSTGSAARQLDRQRGDRRRPDRRSGDRLCRGDRRRLCLINIHRAAQTSRILGTGQSWMFVVRIAFAGIMMFPLNGGFSAGQALVLQAAMSGLGMAKAVDANAIQAVGPDATVVAQPMIPGTEDTVAGLIDSELCMDLVNLAANATLVPIPQPITVSNSAGGFTTWRYSLSPGNESGDPVCGTATVRQSPQNEQTVAGVSVDMATVRAAVVSDVLNGSIRSRVQNVAQNLWQNKTAASLAPLQSIFQNAVNTYTASRRPRPPRSRVQSTAQSRPRCSRRATATLISCRTRSRNRPWVGPRPAPTTSRSPSSTLDLEGQHEDRRCAKNCSGP
jgi:hypothetical protein